VTDQTTASSAADASKSNHRSIPLGRTLMWLGVAGASAALTFFVLRAATSLRRGPAPSDETAERVQALIDEANRLIKTLDEKKQQP